jgi:magnesium chelatase subunit D
VTAAHRALVEGDAPWRRLPVSITDDRLVGGLDVAETLARGTRVLARGLLAEADGGTLLLARAGRRAGARGERARRGARRRRDRRRARRALGPGGGARERRRRSSRATTSAPRARAARERLALHVDLPPATPPTRRSAPSSAIPARTARSSRRPRASACPG